MDKKFKYAKFKKIAKYADGGTSSIINSVGALGSNMIQNAAYNSDGSVNTNQYAGASALGGAASGAAAGLAFGPIGAGIGAAIGGGLGLYKGITGAKAINKQATEKEAAEKAYQEQLAAQKAEFEKQQQDNYNKAYYNVNSLSGNQGVSLYPNGGTMKYPDGGRMSPSEWDAFNEKKGYMLHPKIVNNGKVSGDYKEYYDPKKFVPEINKDGIVKWTKIGDPNYNFQTGIDVPVMQYTAPPILLPGNTYMGDTANKKTYASVDKKALGGKLNPIASDIVKAEGATHAEGGIKIDSKNEVEDQEIIKGNKVYSDRLTLPNSKITIAEEAEKLGKMKGKYEKLTNSSDYREKNAGQRMKHFADKKLNELFEYQEDSKLPVNNPNTFDLGGVMNAAQTLIPYVDNIYNASLINKTPNIPVPTTKEAYYAKALPLKTDINVSNQLNNVDDSYRNFVTDLNNNTSSSNVVRGNKLAAFAKTLQSKNSIYQDKLNAETSLINANQQNIQNVENANTQNAQNIKNINLAATDQYNYNNALRADDILRRKSANVSDVVNNATTQIQDYNAKKLDSERILLNLESTKDSAGMAALIGTSTMNDLVKDDTSYKRVEKALQNRPKDLENFYSKYGKRN